MTSNNITILDLCPDVFGLVLEQLQKSRFNQVMAEFTDPRWHKALKRLLKQEAHGWYSGTIHPGRYLISITYPQRSSRSLSKIPTHESEYLNLYGMQIVTGWRYNYGNNPGRRQYNLPYTIAQIHKYLADNNITVPKTARLKRDLLRYACQLTYPLYDEKSGLSFLSKRLSASAPHASTSC